MTKIKNKARRISLKGLQELKKYLPQSLVQYLRDQLGQRWAPNMHRIVGGTPLLPEAFTEPNKGRGWNPDVHLDKKIRLNRTVKEVLDTFDEDDTEKKSCGGERLLQQQPTAFSGRGRCCYSGHSNQHS